MGLLWLENARNWEKSENELKALTLKRETNENAILLIQLQQYTLFMCLRDGLCTGNFINESWGIASLLCFDFGPPGLTPMCVA